MPVIRTFSFDLSTTRARTAASVDNLNEKEPSPNLQPRGGGGARLRPGDQTPARTAARPSHCTGANASPSTRTPSAAAVIGSARPSVMAVDAVRLQRRPDEKIGDHDRDQPEPRSTASPAEATQALSVNGRMASAISPLADQCRGCRQGKPARSKMDAATAQRRPRRRRAMPAGRADERPNRRRTRRAAPARPPRRRWQPPSVAGSSPASLEQAREQRARSERDHRADGDPVGTRTDEEGGLEGHHAGAAEQHPAGFSRPARQPPAMVEHPTGDADAGQQNAAGRLPHRADAQRRGSVRGEGLGGARRAEQHRRDDHQQRCPRGVGLVRHGRQASGPLMSIT